MAYRSYLFLLGVVLTNIFISCNSPSENKMGVIIRECYSIIPEINGNRLEKTQYLVDSILSLNIPENVTEIGIDKIMITDNHVYILDSEINKRLFCFNNKGNLTTSIGERGHARGEFIGKPDEFFVDSKNRLHVFDKIGHKINIFREDGTVEEVIETSNYYPHSIGLTSNNNYMMYFIDGYREQIQGADVPASLILLDENGENSKKLLISKGEMNCVISEHTFFQNCNRLAFIPCFSDSVVIFKNDTVEKIVSFDFNGKALCKEKPKVLYGDDYSFMDDYQEMLGIESFQESDSYVYINFIYKQQDVSWLFNKKTGQTFCATSLFEGVQPFRYYCLNEDKIVAYIDHGYIEEFKKYYNRPEFQENLKKSADCIKDMLEGKIQVPALVFFSLKQGITKDDKTL